MENRILICDDDQAICSSLSLVLKRAGYATDVVYTPSQAIDFLRSQTPQLILMDMNYSNSTDGEEGLTLLKQVRIWNATIPVVLITAWGSIELAVKGIQAGAFDFIVKPWNNINLLSVIQTAIELSGKQSKQIAKGNFSKIIGKSPLLTNIFDTIERIAPTNASVLICGESGTGKELIAEAIHNNSKRVKEPFVKVNLGGISQSLFESEMFGHKKGAFTDAYYDRVGRFELANKGSIFLDEIGDLDAICQVKLLRVLQDRTFESLGDSKTKQADVRVVSATNKNLADMIAKNTFREDLFYRINLITIQMPTLRERKEDIPLLVHHFAKMQAESNGLPLVSFTSEAMTYLQQLPFPGNIRELKNLIDRSILIASSDTITDKDLKTQYRETPTAANKNATSFASIDDMEKQMIELAMDKYQGNLSKVANELGITRQSLYRRLSKYNILSNLQDE